MLNVFTQTHTHENITDFYCMYSTVLYDPYCKTTVHTLTHYQNLLYFSLGWKWKFVIVYNIQYYSSTRSVLRVKSLILCCAVGGMFCTESATAERQRQKKQKRMERSAPLLSESPDTSAECSAKSSAQCRTSRGEETR